MSRYNAESARLGRSSHNAEGGNMSLVEVQVASQQVCALR